jgi:phage-related protein
MAKSIVFMGDSLAQLRTFPTDVRRAAGITLRQVQMGFDPDDWKPVKTIGPGVREIRVRDKSGAFRVIYLAKLKDAIYVLHAFQKKSEATALRDIELAAKRLAQI